MLALIKKLTHYFLHESWHPTDQQSFLHNFHDCSYDIKMRIVSELYNSPETLRSILLSCKSFGAILDDPQFLKLLLKERGAPVFDGSNLPIARLKAQFGQRRTPNPQAGNTQVH